MPRIQLVRLLHSLTYTSKLTVMVGKERKFTTKEKISIFPLRNLYLYVATFQQQLYVWYVFPSSSDIRELTVAIMLSLIDNTC